MKKSPFISAGALVCAVLCFVPALLDRSGRSTIPPAQSVPPPATAGAMKLLTDANWPAPVIEKQDDHQQGSLGTNVAATLSAPPLMSADLPMDIHEQIRAARHWFAQSFGEDGEPRFIASVRGQKFDFIAEAGGVQVRPWSDATAWSWRMTPADGARAKPASDKTRVSYARGAGVTEWFENGERGVEQGFTLATGGGEPVRKVSLRVTTGLRLRLRPDADGVDFLDATGAAQLHYDQLYAFDAAGRALPAWIELPEPETQSPKPETQNPKPETPSPEPRTHTLVLAVNTTGAKFPVTIDPVISLASERIEHPELVAGDLFGATVAAWGDFIAIGAPRHQVGAVPNAGVVYVFRRGFGDLQEWTLLQKIEPPNPHNPGEFGRALGLSEFILAVSAHRLTLVEGSDVPQDVVHVFELTSIGSVYALRATLSDPTINFDPVNFFGRSLSVSTEGTRIAVGSPASLSVGGPAVNTGKAFLYGRDVGGPDNWGLIRTHQPPLLLADARFGHSVAVDGDRLAVSAPGYVEAPAPADGAVFLYEEHPLLPGPVAHKLSAPALPGLFQLQGFGERVALSGSQLAVGAPGSSAVVVYERRNIQLNNVNLLNVQWVPGILTVLGASASVGEGGFNQFGSLFNLSFGTLVVGLEINLVPPAGLDALVRFEHQGDGGGDPALNWKKEPTLRAESINLRGIANLDVSGGVLVVTSTNDNYGGGTFDYGVAVAMQRRGGSWVATQRFLADLPLAADDLAGTSLAVSDDLLVVGAPGHDVSGVADSGAVHVFRRYSGLAPNPQTLQHGWTLATTLVNDPPQANGRLGASVGVADGLIVAGAPGRNSAAGTVSVWKRTSEAATSWTAHAEVSAPGAAAGDQFGAAIAFNGGTLAVGSPAAGAGRVDLFRRETANPWTHLKTLNPHANDARFGAALALDVDGSLIVGAPEADAGATDNGRAYLYRREETEIPPLVTALPEWIEEGSFSGSGDSAGAGASVAIHRGWAFVGAPGEGIELGPPVRGGRVHVLRRDQTGGQHWSETAVIAPPISTDNIAQFGSAVALDEHTAVVGARGAATGGPIQITLAGGAAFAYSRIHGGAGAWRYTAKLIDLRSEPGDRLGNAVALDHDHLFIGSPRADVANAGSAGAVTLFERQGATWSLLREVPDESTHRIGSTVAVDGDWMVIGSTGDWDGTSEDPADGGQVFVVRRHDGAGGNWNVVNRVIRPGLPGATYVDTDRFGRSLDLSGRTFVAGSTVGVHAFDIAPDGQVTHLGPLPGHADDVEYGYAVAIHGQYIAVTARGSAVPTARGSVAVFARTAEHTIPFGAVNVQSHWKRESRLTSTAHGFGTAVVLHGTTAAISAPNDGDSGLVWIHVRDQGGAGNWGAFRFIELEIGDEGYQPLFGSGLALDGDILAVGVRGQEEDNGDGTSSYGGGYGYIFQRHAGGFNNWGQVGTLANGPAVAVSGDWVLAGGPPGYERDEFGDRTYTPNPVVLHHRNAGGADRWGRVQTFLAPNADPGHTWDFGAAVALDGSTLVVGAPGERRSASDITPGRAFIYDVPLISLQIWKDTLFASQYFGGAMTPYSAQAIGDLGDLDGDGIVNAWEAYHGLNPFVADATLAGLLTPSAAVLPGSFVFTWQEAIDPLGLTVTPQWSRNLIDWYDSGAGPSPGDTKTFGIQTINTTATHVTKQATLPTSGDPHVYTRLVLELP